MSKKRKIDIKVPFITRLEGEGSLELLAKNGKIDTLHLKIFEPPRLFEKFLEGRSYQDVPDLSARICGICPMAYQLTSILAMERLFDVSLPEHLVQLRRLMNLGEWVQSHALHIHFLAAPDFLGFDHALEMAKRHPELLRRGMQIQQAGNALMSLLGGRSVHPVGLRVGGFSKLPDPEHWYALRQQIADAKTQALELLRWCARLELPDYSHDFTWVSLREENGYAINGGTIVAAQVSKSPSKNSEIHFSHQQYATHFIEHQVPHSTALYCLLDGKDYLVGPLARINNNFSQLPDAVQQAAHELGLTFPNTNMFTSIQARALEIYGALYQAEEILAKDCPTGEAFVPYTVKGGDTCYCTEAPRGMIYHGYRLDDAGRVKKCTIIPPTSQNQARIEQDLKQSVNRFGLEHNDEELKLFCEKVIRNYDPCISCSTHFLDLTILRTDPA